MTNAPIILYTVKCTHVVPAPSTLVQGVLHCPIHNDISPITGIHVYEWRAKCADCKFSRWAGLGEATAGIFANGHWRRNPSHDVKTEYTINPEAVKTEAKFYAWHHPTESRTRV